MKTALVIGAIAALLAPAAHAATTPGISPSRAKTRIEVNVRVVAPDLVGWASEQLRQAKRFGGPRTIANARHDLRIARAGMDVDHAACLGVRRARGGYTSFRCKLALSIGFSDGVERGRVRGTYTRLSNGSWRWHTTWLNHWSAY
jgi:hypothetical protein